MRSSRPLLRDRVERVRTVALPSGPTRIPLSKANAAHSARNVDRWNGYLPADCVRAMVRLGWDLST